MLEAYLRAFWRETMQYTDLAQAFSFTRFTGPEYNSELHVSKKDTLIAPA